MVEAGLLTGVALILGPTAGGPVAIALIAQAVGSFSPVKPTQTFTCVLEATRWLAALAAAPTQRSPNVLSVIQEAVLRVPLAGSAVLDGAMGMVHDLLVPPPPPTPKQMASESERAAGKTFLKPNEPQYRFEWVWPDEWSFNWHVRHGWVM